MNVEMYACGTCDSMTLLLIGEVEQWYVTCGNGHHLIPIPGTVIQIVGEEAMRTT
jgi:hypothetical protein